MAIYQWSVLGNRPPIQQIITTAITGTGANMLAFPTAMTRFVAKNTGTAPLTFIINGNPDLADVLAVGESIDETFPEFDHVVLGGTTGSSYRIRVG